MKYEHFLTLLHCYTYDVQQKSKEIHASEIKSSPIEEVLCYPRRVVNY